MIAGLEIVTVPIKNIKRLHFKILFRFKNSTKRKRENNLYTSENT